MAYERIATFGDCVSAEEKSQRFSVTAINVIIWLFVAIFVLSTMGMALLFVGFTWLLNRLLSEYNVRRIQALGATVSPTQFPEVYKAASEVCGRFGVSELPRIIVVPSGEMNALAIAFAKKKVVVVLSELMEGIIDNPARLRFLLAHEICHQALDHGARGVFEIYKPARYRQGRELTCDNAGVVASEDVAESRAVLKMLCVGRGLFARVNEAALVSESREIYSGFTGWLLRQYLTHPPAGARLSNAVQFHTANGGAPSYEALPGMATG